MSELFDALKKLKKHTKKHFVQIQGKTIEVSLQEKINIIRNGEQNYKLEGNRPVKIEVKFDRSTFNVIDNLTKDPFWPEEQFKWIK